MSWCFSFIDSRNRGCREPVQSYVYLAYFYEWYPLSGDFLPELMHITLNEQISPINPQAHSRRPRGAPGQHGGALEATRTSRGLHTDGAPGRAFSSLRSPIDVDPRAL